MAMTDRARRPLGLLVATAIAAALFVAWGWIARWTELRCDTDRCVHTERRLLTFPFQRETVLARRELAEQPERIRVVVVDSNRRGADLVIDHEGRALRVEQGGLADMTARATILRSSMNGVAPIAASVSPHPFGLLTMAVLGLFVAVAAHRARIAMRAR